MGAEPQLIIPDWPAPSSVGALVTTRSGGSSQAPYQGFNLGDHVGDDPQRVQANRQLLQRQLGDEVACQWLSQVHGTEVARLEQPGPVIEADAAMTLRPGVACLVMTADCLPVLICDRAGSRVAAVHAGWRGLADGIIEATIASLAVPAEQLLCWLGPAIGPKAFEVGGEVRQRFIDYQPDAQQAFVASASGAGKWLADIYQLARLRLQRSGVEAVFGGEYCTYTDSERFFSYRREGVTGRMASLIWIKSEN